MVVLDRAIINNRLHNKNVFDQTKSDNSIFDFKKTESIYYEGGQIKNKRFREKRGDTMTNTRII